MAPPLMAGDVDRFRNLIALRLGLHFEDARFAFLADVLGRRFEACRGSSGRYLDALERAPTRDEIAALALELTVPETYFFRHNDQFRAFSDVVVPERMKARARERSLRILSAGCASGEEAYTLAMILRELPIDPSWKVSILAVDVNRGVLDKAIAGRFSSWSLRATPPELQSRWFKRVGRDVVLDESIRAQVRFEQHNLSDDDPNLWRTGDYDAVFCRNVVMYFAPRCAQALVERIERSLAPGGYLFLGHAETLRGLSSEFHLCQSHNAFYYRRKSLTGEAAADPPPYAARAEPAPRPPAAEPNDGWFEEIARASDRIRILASGPAESAPDPLPDAPACDLRPILELLRQERFADALGLVQAMQPELARKPDVRLLEAVLLAHGGDLARAEEACNDLLHIDELSAGAHYVLALCCDRAGDTQRAAEHDQIAAHLDPGFAMPRLHLGLLARRAGKHAEARRELGQALALLGREDASRLLFFGGGFNRDALVALCRAELVACGGQP